MKMEQRFRFGKNERLSNRVVIAELFSKGKSFYEGPCKVYWANANNNLPHPAQLLISIPRKNLKRAVDRNLMKRRFREAWRKNKPELYAHLEMQKRKLLIAIVFHGFHPIDYSALEAIIIVILRRLKQGNEKSAG